MSFNSDVLRLDPARETARICGRIRGLLIGPLRRRGLVIGLSGGIDSSVTVALAARAVGPARVLALEMPERHSAAETLALSSLVANHFGLPRLLEEITEPLEAVGFYQRYIQAVRLVLPDYGPGWTSKLVTESVLEKSAFSLFSLVARRPDGTLERRRLPLRPYLEIVAATNFKQRIRKMFEYYHADRLNFAVAGTPNRLEYDQGFFVKLGDGAADLKPIAHLYKSQVYQLAEYLGVPGEVIRRPPTTDTYSLPQGQDEFYFSLPLAQFDLCLYGKNHGIAPERVAAVVDLTPEQIERVYRDIDAKRAATRYLHLPPLLIDEISEIAAPLPQRSGPANALHQ